MLLCKKPVSGKSCSPTKGGLICLYMLPLLVSHTTAFVICISVYIRILAITLLPLREVSSRDLAWELAWVRQLRSGSCHYRTAATKCNVSLLANKPRQWKSMLTHQGWFNLLIYATFNRITNYRVCNFHIYLYIRDSAPSHYIPLREVSSRDLTWETHG